MTRKTTIRKEKIVICEFKKLLRSGKDYTTSSMYKEAGKTVFLAPDSVGNIIRRHYRGIISPEMKDFLKNLNGMKHEEKVTVFGEKFELCQREARLIIRYINR